MKYTFSLLLFFWTFAALSQIPAPKKDTYVNDFAKVLSKKDIKSINQSINRIEKRTGVQVAVVLVNKIPKQYNIEEYALLIARRWKVGNKEDGLVYVAAIKQRKQRLEVARNLESIFTEDRSLAALDRVKPFFREADYAGGVTELADAIMNDLDYAKYSSLPKVDTPAVVANSVAAKHAVKEEKEDNTLLYTVIILVAGVVLYMIFRPRQAIVGPGGGYGGSGYGGGYGYGGGGSNLGSFAAGAATGYMANELMDRNKERREEEERRRQHEEERRRQEQYEAERRAEEARRQRAEMERKSDTYGNWGSSRGSSGGSSSSGGGSSPSSSGGFSGSGATSDW